MMGEQLRRLRLRILNSREGLVELLDLTARFSNSCFSGMAGRGDLAGAGGQRR